MTKLEGLPPGTLSRNQAAKRLGRSSAVLIKSGINNFLPYYEVGRSKLYLTQAVNKLQYWLFVRTGLIALGELYHNSPLLHPRSQAAPPDEDDTIARWRFLDAWFEDDNFGTTCPQCAIPAVQAHLDGPVWCPECRIIEIEELK